MQIEKTIIAFIQVFANLINQINDYALENGINPETISTLRDNSKRKQDQVRNELDQLLKDDPDLNAIEFIKKRSSELGLNTGTVESLISSLNWSNK